MFLKIITVAALATFEIYAAIPAGFAFGLSPYTIFFASITGGLVGVFVAAYDIHMVMACGMGNIHIFLVQA